ncbi:hypothetical protein [Gulosibacter chungangensis]|uniref:hypothetical protein n=1 Tax=Gulosibacter chungangensis TaxID=979746 RepID=UPI001CE45491|nr:hypothetical protein [Gulosibacter chungangensis]
MRKQPDARIRRGLAGADDHVFVGRVPETSQIIDRDDSSIVSIVSNVERWSGLRRDARGKIVRVDNPAALGDFKLFA